MISNGYFSMFSCKARLRQFGCTVLWRQMATNFVGSLELHVFTFIITYYNSTHIK
jgi:hypothetical protein